MIKKGSLMHIQREFLEYWKNRGFLEFSPVSVISPPELAEVLFVSSGFFNYLKKIETDGSLGFSYVGAQPCIKFGFRNLSPSEMDVKDGYFKFFRQLSCGAENISVSWLVEQVWDYLTQVSGLNPERIYFGINPCCPEIKDYWEKAGVKNDNILYPDHSAVNFSLTNVNLKGYYHPFIYDRGENHLLACKEPDCHINCDCGRFLELGDIGIIQAGENLILDHGIGLERIASIRLGLEKVSDIPEFSELSTLLSSYLSLSQNFSLILSDYFRAILVLIEAGLKPSNKKQGYCLRNLLRQAFEIMPEEKLNRETLYFILESAAESIEGHRLAYLEESLEVVMEELYNYQRLLARGANILSKFVQKEKRKTLTQEEEDFFYQTHGLTPEVVQKIISEL